MGTQQTGLFKGIYEFEDPSGSLVAAKIPNEGSVDLYAGTVIIVKPNQQAMLIYKGKPADIVWSGTYQINTEVFPIISKLANWQFGFQNPLRSELIFFSRHVFTSRRWGTPQPVLINFENMQSPVPIRAFGTYNIKLVDPTKFFDSLFGTRSTYTISEVEDFIQGQIAESLPAILGLAKLLENLSVKLSELSKKLELEINSKLQEYGFVVTQLQLQSALPTKEILDALEAKTALQIIGSQKDYLVYKAATSLGTNDSGKTNDPMHMMMGLMLGKGLLEKSGSQPEPLSISGTSTAPATAPNTSKVQFCTQCGAGLQLDARFCQSCGRKV